MSYIEMVLAGPLLGVLALLFVPSWKTQTIRNIALNSSLLTFLISLLLWIEFDSSTAMFQFTNGICSPNVGLESSAFQTELVKAASSSSFSALNFSFGVDGISLFFIILTTLLVPICILVSWTNIDKYVKE